MGITAGSAECGRFLGALVIMALASVLPACTPPLKPIASQAYTTHHLKRPEPPSLRPKPVEQAVTQCSPVETTDLSAAEKTRLFQQFDRWYSANRDGNDPAAGDPNGASSPRSSVTASSASPAALACPGSHP